MKPKHLSSLASTILTLAMAPTILAASDSWKADAAGLWNDTANWTGGNIPGTPAGIASPDVATFGLALSAGRAVTVDSNRNIGGITFSNITNNFGYTLSGGSLKLTNAGIIQLTGASGTYSDTISSPIEIQGNASTATITSSGSNVRLLSISAITGISTGSNVTNLILNGVSTGVNAMTGIIGDGGGGGKLSISKSGAGTWSLQNTGNSFSGGTTVNVGTLQALTAGSLGTGTVTLAGGQLHLINASNIAYNNNTIVSGDTQISATRVSGTGGAVTHTLGTLSIGANTLTLAAFSGITGGLIFGNTALTGNASFTTNVITTLTLGSISGGSFSITKGGTVASTGTLILANNNIYSGGTNINFGTLQVGNNGNTGDMGSGAVSLASGTTLVFARSNAATFINAISGAGVVRNANATSIIDLTNDTHTGATQIQNGVLQTNNTNSNFVLGTSNAATFYGVLGLKSDFTGGLGTGSGQVSWLAGVNTSGGFAVIDAATRSVNIGGNVTSDTLTLNTGGFVGGTLATSNSRIKFGDVNGTALGTVDFKNSINLGSGDRSLIFVVDGFAQVTGNVTGNISGSGVASGTGDAVVKFGNGNLKLSGNNTYTGRTRVGGNGSIILGSATAFSPNTWMSLEGGNANALGGILGLASGDLTASLGQSATNVHFASSGGFAAFGANRSVTLNSGATLVWNTTPSFLTNTQFLNLGQLKADGKITLTNGIDLNGATRTIAVNAGDGTAPVDAEISGALIGSGGGLTKSGDGVLVLSGNSTYTGVTNVTAGTLTVDGSLVPASAVTVSAAATLAGSGTIGGSVASSGTIAPGNAITGTLTTGPATLTGGRIAIKASGTTANKLLSTGIISLTNTTLTVTATSPLTADSYIIAEGTGVSGTFVSTSLPAGFSLQYTPNKVILNRVVSVTDYVSWASVSGLDESNRGPYQDPDHDGVNNLLEYILGGLPIGSGAADPTILPTQSLQANNLVFAYQRSAASKSDTTQVVQTSTNLINWTNFATIGSASAGPVTIVAGGSGTDSISVAIPRSTQQNGKLFARLSADPDFPYLGPPPGMMELLQHWAPVIYQDVRTDTDTFIFMPSRQLYGARDCIVPINFDGEFDVANNWNNSRYQPSEQGTLADRLTPPLQAKSYAAVVESGLFYFLNYGFYHSGQDSAVSQSRHQNDWEQVVLVIRKDDTEFGGFEAMMTQFHTDQNIYQPQNITFSGQRPIIYIESNGGLKGHGIQAYTNQNPGDRGVVYTPGDASQNVTSVVISNSGNWATAPGYEYKLIPIGEMWGLMNKNGLYDPYSDWNHFNYARAENYPDYEHEPQGGNPPWDRTFFMDPLVFFAQNSPALQPELATDTYVFDPYLNCSSNQVGPVNPNGVLPVSIWLPTQLGGTSGLAWTLRNETILYHRSGTGSGDRMSFNHRQATGNFSIQGRVHSVQDLGDSQTGIMIRNSLSATSRMIALWVGPDQRVHLQYRNLDGGSLGSVVSGGIPLTDQPVSLRLQRVGDQITASYAYNGDFITLETVSLSMLVNIFAGMTASSTDTSYFSASTITDLELITTP